LLVIVDLINRYRRGSSFKRSQPLTIHALEELVTAYRNAPTSSAGSDLLSNPLRLVDAAPDLASEPNQSGKEEREEAEERLKVGLGDALRLSIGRFQPDILDWLVSLDGDIVSSPLFCSTSSIFMQGDVWFPLS
jgi:hypothetical protein